ncbi:glycosyltransferase family 2 protein [Oceanirhabdus seepicola]|uniref:Glycosyltransferase family 2 protein n=1 Tax=Oceanirhabdus seepicola TaxID=2828781 RepID=A0A9J6NYZ9_9CLOT|nr:glycosyltransferase family 2 protein [Oceanirhabdus seepicola]MCM1989284.1 glycosyltransferase family 2 protein [Oceanirhabdus seepicola]
MMSIKYCIDFLYSSGGKIKVVGWVFSTIQKDVEISIKEIDDYGIKRILRLDVGNVHQGYEQANYSGFEINFKGENFKNVILRFKDKKNEARYNIDISKITDERLRSNKNREVTYNEWFLKKTPNKAELEKQKKCQFKYNPLISIVVPTYNTKKSFLIDMIESLRKQSYSKWELCIADGNSTLEITRKVLKEYEKKDKRIKVKYLDKNYMISGNTNEALTLVKGEYIGFLDHDDLLTPNCLYEIVKVINEQNKPDFIYTDEDKVDEEGKWFYEPYFKSDFSIDLLRSNNYICHFSVVKYDLLKKVGKFRSSFDGAQDYDFILRIIENTNEIYHIPKVLYHWRVHEQSTANSLGSKKYAIDAGKRALEEHLLRVNINANVELHKQIVCVYRVKYKILKYSKVSIVIANKDHKEDLEKCINSIFRNSYRNYEIIIVENNSESKEIFEYYKNISKNNKIKILCWENEFNYSAINNFGAKNCDGEYILFLNNDTEIISEDAIEEMVSIIERKEVGIVGAKLYYSDDTIQHAGVILGIGGVAGHVYKHFDRNSVGKSAKLKVSQNFSAVTGAAMLIKRKVFEEVNGFDENYEVAFNDVDLCLRVRKKDYNIVWTPYAEFYHYESKTRGIENTIEKQIRFNREVNRFRKIWKSILDEGDPYYNCNLTLNKRDCSLREID